MNILHLASKINHPYGRQNFCVKCGELIEADVIYTEDPDLYNNLKKYAEDFDGPIIKCNEA